MMMMIGCCCSGDYGGDSSDIGSDSRGKGSD